LEKIYYTWALFFLWRFDPISRHGFPLRGFAITLTGHTTLGRTLWTSDKPDTETSHNTQHSYQTNIHGPAGFELTTPATDGRTPTP